MFYFDDENGFEELSDQQLEEMCARDLEDPEYDNEEPDNYEEGFDYRDLEQTHTYNKGFTNSQFYDPFSSNTH